MHHRLSTARALLHGYGQNIPHVWRSRVAGKLLQLHPSRNERAHERPPASASVGRSMATREAIALPCPLLLRPTKPNQANHPRLPRPANINNNAFSGLPDEYDSSAEFSARPQTLPTPASKGRQVTGLRIRSDAANLLSVRHPGPCWCWIIGSLQPQLAADNHAALGFCARLGSGGAELDRIRTI